MDARALVARVIGRVAEHRAVARLRAVLDVYGASAGGLLANGLAYAALFAALPTTLLMLGITGFVARDPAYQQALIDQLGTAFPPMRELLDDALVAVSEGAGLSSLLGAIGLIWAVNQFYGTLDTAFARIFSATPERNLAHRTLLGFAFVLLLVGVVVLGVGLTWFVALLDTVLPSGIPTAGALADLLTSPLGMLVGATAVLAVAYRVVPPRAPRWTAIALPTVVVAVALTLLTQAFGLLAPLLVRSAAFAGSLAAAFVALAWLSFSFQAVLLGAAWVRVLDPVVPRDP